VYVYAGNATDVMLTHAHDRQFVIVARSPSVAGDFQTPV